MGIVKSGLKALTKGEAKKAPKAAAKAGTKKAAPKAVAKKAPKKAPAKTKAINKYLNKNAGLTNRDVLIGIAGAGAISEIAKKKQEMKQREKAIKEKKDKAARSANH